MLWIHAKGEMASIAFCCFFFLFLWFYLSKLLSIFQTGKKAPDCFFLYGVLSGKTACNKFMHRDQSFHSKTQSFFPFFFSFFALCLGLFTEQTTSLMLLVVPPQGADGV